MIMVLKACHRCHYPSFKSSMAHSSLVLTSSKSELKAALETYYIVAMQRGEGHGITDEQEASSFLPIRA